MKRLLLLLALALFTFNSFAQSTTNKPKVTAYDQSQSLEVFVNKKGKIQLNGKKVDLKELDRQLLQLKKNNGFVKFAREKATKKSTRDKMVEVSKLLRKHGLVTKIYTDKSFTKEFLF